MRKIPTLFVRDPERNLHYVTDEVNPACEWVAAGEGVATRKYDGSCCLVRDGVLYKRHEVKAGKDAPEGFEPLGTDEATGKTVGWMPVGEGPEGKWHRDAFARRPGLRDGTYELCGPKVNGNPEGFAEHVLLAHEDADAYPDAPRTFEGLRVFLADFKGEGLVWHHPDGRMAKVKRRDFPAGVEEATG